MLGQEVTFSHFKEQQQRQSTIVFQKRNPGDFQQNKRNACSIKKTLKNVFHASKEQVLTIGKAAAVCWFVWDHKPAPTVPSLPPMPKTQEEVVTQAILDTLHHSEPALFQNKQSLSLHFDPKFKQPVNSALPLWMQGVSNGALLCGCTCWAYCLCTFVNFCTKNSDRVCDVCKKSVAHGMPEGSNKRPLESQDDDKNKNSTQHQQLSHKWRLTTKASQLTMEGCCIWADPTQTKPWMNFCKIIFPCTCPRRIVCGFKFTTRFQTDLDSRIGPSWQCKIYTRTWHSMERSFPTQEPHFSLLLGQGFQNGSVCQGNSEQCGFQAQDRWEMDGISGQGCNRWCLA